MRTNSLRLIVSSAFVAALTACPPPPVECIDGTEDVCDGGGLPPDFCNSREEAEADSTNCHLTVTTGGAAQVPLTGVFLSRQADGGADQDWYVAQMPGGLTPRTLLHVVGGYQAPQTAVNISVNVLKQGAMGLTTVANGIDRHGAAAPKPVDLIVPFGESNVPLYVLVADEGGAGAVRVDNRNTYSLAVELIENPDVNEPNDTTPTPITLTAATSGVSGSQTGYLGTNDDVDSFSFTVSGGGRQIVYVHITEEGTHPTNPPPPYKLGYTLYAPDNTPVSEGYMENEFLAIDLATARLATTGTYTVKVAGHRANGSSAPIKGDLRVQYKVTASVMPDLDTNEPNESAATARVVTLSRNGRTTITGKLAHVPDEEYFSLALPAIPSPSTLRYRVVESTSGGRFAPLTGTPVRQIRISERVTTGATPSDWIVACRTNRTVCPRSQDAIPMLLDTICGFDPPQCSWSERTEELPRITGIRNLVGSIPIAANHAGNYLILFHDQGSGQSKYADDRDFNIELEWFDDTDEAGRAGGPTVQAITGTQSTVNGELTFGYGKIRDPNEWFKSMEGLRGRDDYDAVDTDSDLFRFDVSPAMGDQSWELSWNIEHSPGASGPPSDIGLELTFCNTAGASDGGLCAGSKSGILVYADSNLTPWYLTRSASNARMLFTKTSNGTSTTFTVAPVTCSCLNSTRVAAGSYFANISALHRLSNDPVKYHITQRITTYPSSYTLDGGTVSCPVVDAGCGYIPL